MKSYDFQAIRWVMFADLLTEMSIEVFPDLKGGCSCFTRKSNFIAHQRMFPSNSLQSCGTWHLVVCLLTCIKCVFQKQNTKTQKWMVVVDGSFNVNPNKISKQSPMHFTQADIYLKNPFPELSPASSI